MANDMIELYLASVRERGHTDATITSYRRYLKAADRRLAYGLLRSNETELRAYLWRDGLRVGTRRTYRSALRSFFQWAVESGELDFDPTQRLKSIKVGRGLPRVAEDHEVEWVVTQTEQPYRLWGTLAAYAGVRCIEVSRLHREHVTEDLLTIHRGKGNKARTVPTHSKVWATMQQLPPGPVTDMDNTEVARRFWKYCVAQGRAGVSMHRLRGWWCSNGYRVTKDLLAMQRGMGHEDPRTTAGYIKLPGDAIRTAVDGLPTFEGPEDAAGGATPDWRRPFG